MKLHTKLTLFTTLSIFAVLALFIALLPQIMQRVAFSNTNNTLIQQKQKVLEEIESKGINHYLEGESAYGSYSMLKDEYISLEQTDQKVPFERQITGLRLIESDTINYRILIHGFKWQGQNYLLEIGKKTASISAEGKALQKAATYILFPLAIVILLIQILYNRYLLKPLAYIIKSRLTKASFPFNQHEEKIKSTTWDFLYLDESITQLMQQINDAFEKEREFSSNASHELMTPISIMQSKVENLMSEENLSDYQYKKLDETMQILGRLKKIVNALLLISRVENSQFLSRDKVRVKEILNLVVEELSHRMEQKELTLKVDLTDVELKNVNKDLFFQLFYNIINNAIKFNKPQGSIIINDNQLTNNQYAIVIKDSGIGIDEQQLGEIFHRFKKATGRNEGYGLGLAIVQSIAKHQGVTLDVQSEKDKGTVFKIIFQKQHL